MASQPLDPMLQVTSFLQKAAEDKRLKPVHIGLYMGLFLQWSRRQGLNPFPVDRREAMQLARIFSRVTYHKGIRELHDWGYIHYDPSYDYYRGSYVYMLHFKLVKEKEPKPGVQEGLNRDDKPVPSRLAGMRSCRGPHE